MARSDASFPRASVPESEIELFERQIRAKPEYGDPEFVIGAYRAVGLNVLPDPFNAQVAALIVRALREEAPLSVLRIGDGEVSLLAHRADTATPNLDCFAFAASIGRRGSTKFELSGLWMAVLRDLSLLAICQADIVGVRGFSGFRSGLKGVDAFLRVLSRDLRAGVGVWRSIDLMLGFAEQGMLQGKTIASAHLYFRYWRIWTRFWPARKQSSA